MYQEKSGNPDFNDRTSSLRERFFVRMIRLLKKDFRSGTADVKKLAESSNSVSLEGQVGDNSFQLTLGLCVFLRYRPSKRQALQAG
jgi:hypothetical protein